MGKSYKRNDGRYLSAEQIVVDSAGMTLPDALAEKSSIITRTVSVTFSVPASGYGTGTASAPSVPGYTPIGIIGMTNNQTNCYLVYFTISNGTVTIRARTVATSQVNVTYNVTLLYAST